MNMEMFQRAAIGSVAFAAVLTDVYRKRIPNSLIFSGLLLAFGCQLKKWGALGSILFLGGTGLPILLLGGLYYFRMLGAGDIKLFAVLGGFLGVREICSCMAAAFLAGGLLSFLLMLYRGNFYRRLVYMKDYIQAILTDKQWKPYRLEGQEDGEFCFTIPIFISVLCWIGGWI